MMIVFRSQVGLMARLACSRPRCITTASFTYELADKTIAHACVRHDLDARNIAIEEGHVIVDVAYGQEVR